MKRFLRKRLKLNTTLTTDRVGKLSERLPMGRRSGSRCIEFIIRPGFLRPNSR
ncbi:hypothetical protein [Leptospira noguchii]|uniref:hypothetical protein n=1 Tax=Leptospira noguchii TaxID=28182 RepID=UPI00031592B7|nr:hypothetical protein [Leptospira noguchii]